MSDQTEEERDGRAAEETDQGGEDSGNSGSPDPSPGEDAGPMGNPAQDEEALRKEQEDEAS